MVARERMAPAGLEMAGITVAAGRFQAGALCSTMDMDMENPSAVSGELFKMSHEK